jgi:hypothetical protein
MHTFVQLEISHAANTKGGLIENYWSLNMSKIVTAEETAAKEEEGKYHVEVEDKNADKKWRLLIQEMAYA